MKAFFDLIPVVLFFIAFKKFDIYLATKVLMIAITVQVAIVFIVKRKLENMYKISWIAVMIFGGLTLGLRNAMFIKWKPSVINWIFAAVFLASQWVGEKPLVQRMLSKGFEMPKHLWNQVNLAWVVFFILSGILNIIVALQYSEDTWVNFKLFGLTGLSFVFILAQMVILRKYLKTEEEPAPEEAAGETPD